MSVSGIVITFSSDAPLAAAARRALEREEWLEPGIPSGSRLPAVIDAPDPRAARSLVERLGRVPGIASVDVVFVGTAESPGDPGIPVRATSAAPIPIGATPASLVPIPTRTERGTM